ncbi:Cdc6/Cdc18 family protein [Halorubrum pallidum]|uniref:Cdc6/Cdc18 family protein n=1 Tax=Halorubrum pallidum TaxID=1526114 RepID=A0ABD5T390_9EURY
MSCTDWTSSFLPKDVPINHRSYAVSCLTEDGCLHGPSGVGKTCIAQFTVERLRENVVDLNHQYVNCWEDYSRFKTLYTLLEGINKTIDIHRQSTPRDQLLDRLRDYDGPPYVVILDEVDQLEDKSLLYDLYRIRGLTMILIANNEQGVFADVDDRINSRLANATRIHFRQYHHDELVAILQDRVRWGLNPDVIDKKKLESIANNAAGDARVAIGILRQAARTANAQQMNEIPDDVIRKVTPEAKSEIKQKTVDRLTTHQEVLYETITEYGEIPPNELYEEYCNRVGDPKTQRMVRNYLSKLEHYNLIEAEGNTRGRTYRTVE